MKQESLPRQTTDYVVGQEVFTGRYWIDGSTQKPIYRKVFTGTTSSQNGGFAFDGYKVIQIIGGVMTNSDFDFLPFGYCPDNNNFVLTGCVDNNTGIIVQNTYYSSRPKYIAIVDYIK